MKINNFTVKNFEDEKQIMDDQQYQLNKEIEWEKDKAYVLTQVTEKLAVELKQVEDIAETISDRRFASRLLTKLKERNMEYHIHKDYFTSWHKTPEGGYNTGRYLSEFDIDRARDGIHIFGQVRLNKSADRKLDFVVLSKKNDFIKKFVLECQTNLGHLKPMENHRDCVLAREITLRTDFVFLQYSSREIFWDSNISSMDELIDELEFGNNFKVNYSRNGFKESDIPF